MQSVIILIICPMMVKTIKILEKKQSFTEKTHSIKANFSNYIAISIRGLISLILCGTNWFFNFLFYSSILLYFNFLVVARCEMCVVKTLNCSCNHHPQR